jgi:hypothetical protein
MEELGELPQSAPGWLRAKWNGGRGEMFYTFSANKDPGLENRLIHIRDWIRAGRNNGEEWLKRHDPDAPLPRLREEGTIDRAYEMAEEYFSVLRGEFIPFRKAGEKIIYFLMIPDVEHTHNEGHITIIMLYGKR